MAIFCEFKKVSQDRSIFVNSKQVIIISHGASNGTTSIELAGQRTFDVQGTVEEVRQSLELAASG